MEQQHYKGTHRALELIESIVLVNITKNSLHIFLRLYLTLLHSQCHAIRILTLLLACILRGTTCSTKLAITVFVNAYVL